MRDPNYYNPRFGREGGRVGKDDLSVDGKSWEYRNPANFNSHRGGRPGAYYGPDTYNSNSYEYTDPLYDYSYGTVRDAAAEVGVSNINKQAEVDEILAYIQRPMATQADLDDLRDDFSDYKLSQEEIAALNAETPVVEEEEPYVPSKELNSANNLVQTIDAATLSGLASAQIFDAEKFAANPKAKAQLDKYKLNLAAGMTADQNSLDNAYKAVFV